MGGKRTKKVSSVNDELERILALHEERYARWHHYREHGGSDPTWSDGSNMNLIRNHIISFKRQIKELCEKNGVELPNVYSRELPPEVDRDFMANTELIDENASIFSGCFTKYSNKNASISFALFSSLLAKGLR